MAVEEEHEVSFVNQRRKFADSWEYLWEETFIMEDQHGQVQRTPPSRVGPAGYNRKGSGIRYFGAGLRGNLTYRLENLTIPSVFICESEFRHISFRNTSLKDSSFCWNDFIEIDFRDANLSRCDLRCSLYRNVNFAGAVLHRADLRMSTFEGCDFTGADMTGAKLTYDQADGLVLSEQQRQSIDWQTDAGPEPMGG